MEALKKGNLKTFEVPTDETNFRKLLAGRIDIFPNDPIVGYDQIHDIFSDEEAKLFTTHPKEFEFSTMNLIISRNCKDGPLFLKKFNSGLEKLKKSGALEKMQQDLKMGKYKKQKNKWKPDNTSS
jgi:polar amino acid transport system substrate-binding protein